MACRYERHTKGTTDTKGTKGTNDTKGTKGTHHADREQVRLLFAHDPHAAKRDLLLLHFLLFLLCATLLPLRVLVVRGARF